MLAEGSTAQIFEWDENKVVKIFHKNICEASIIEELTKSKKLNETGLSVPKAFEMVNIDGRTGIVLEKVKGLPLTNYLLTNLFSALRYIKIMAKLHADIHKKNSIDLPALKSILQMKIEKSNHFTDLEKEQLVMQLHSLPDGVYLCHCDYHPNNIMVNDEKQVIIDWADATIGDNVADLARTIIILKFGGFSENLSIMQYIFQRIIRLILCKAYLHYYKKCMPFQAKAFRKWNAPVAAARLNEQLTAKERQRLRRLIKFK